MHVVRSTARAALALVLCGPLVLLCGCHHTAENWAAAGRNHGSMWRVVGVAPPQRAAGPERLVVAYRYLGGGTGSEPFHVTVPLADDGRPAWPFGVGGDSRDVPSIVAALPPEQLRGVDFAKLEAYAGRRGRGRKGGLETVTYRGTQTWAENSDVRVVAFGRRMTLTLTPPPYTPERAEMQARIKAFRDALRQLEPGEHLVLLPNRQRRPPGRAQAAALRAALFTPLALGADALELAFAPLWLMVR